MTTARQHYRGPEPGDQYRLLRDVPGENGGDKIALARHVQRGSGHRSSGEGSHQLPAAIDVAPPGKGTMESAPLVFLDVNVDIRLRDPSWQGRRIDHEAGLARHHPGRKSSNARGRRPVARKRVELVTECETQV